MRFLVTRDVEEFAGHAEAFLAARIERNVMATILVRARQGQFAAPGRLFADAPGEAAALRTPPWPLLCTELEPAAADPLLAAWLPEDPGLPAVNADRAARAVASAGAARYWGHAVPGAEAMHICEEVFDPPRPGPGRLRPPGRARARAADAGEQAFELEAGVSGGATQARRWTPGSAHDARQVWDDREPGGDWSASRRPVAGAVRVGPVYTPPEHRTGATPAPPWPPRAVARWRGATGCLLYTDLANPTSNKIYARSATSAWPTGRSTRSPQPRRQPTVPLRRAQLVEAAERFAVDDDLRKAGAPGHRGQLGLELGLAAQVDLLEVDAPLVQQRACVRAERARVGREEDDPAQFAVPSRSQR